MNIREIKDVLMEAEAEFSEMLKELDSQFGAPDAKGMKMLWMGMPKGAKDFIQQTDPKGFDEVSKLMTE